MGCPKTYLDRPPDPILLLITTIILACILSLGVPPKKKQQQQQQQQQQTMNGFDAANTVNRFCLIFAEFVDFVYVLLQTISDRSADLTQLYQEDGVHRENSASHDLVSLPICLYRAFIILSGHWALTNRLVYRPRTCGMEVSA